MSTRESIAEDKFFLGHQWADFHLSEKVALVLLLATPLFFLYSRHWVNNVSIVSCAAMLIALYVRGRSVRVFDIPMMSAMLTIFSAYIAAIIFSQIGRWSFEKIVYIENYRWILGVPVFMFVYWSRLNFAKALGVLAPACLVFGYISSTYIIPADAWGSRATVKFMDPLAFGYATLSLGLLCGASLMFDMKRGAYGLMSAMKVIGLLMGIYLSVRSESRSGWIALPFVLFLVSQSAFELNKRRLLMALSGILILTFSLYYLNDIVYSRVNVAIEEIVSYPWSGGVAPDTSVGFRITSYRLGWHYFFHSPFFGWGERGYGVVKDLPELALFSSQFARDFAYQSLFHSEWITQAVRYGVLGLFAVCIVFFVPLAIFFRFAFRGRQYERQVACMGLAYMGGLLAATIGDEVYKSKAMITFTVFLLAGLLATLVRLRTDFKNANATGN